MAMGIIAVLREPDEQPYFSTTQSWIAYGNGSYEFSESTQDLAQSKHGDPNPDIHVMWNFKNMIILLNVGYRMKIAWWGAYQCRYNIL